LFARNRRFLDEGAVPIALACIVLMTGATIKRELFPTRPPIGTSAAPATVPDWESYLAGGKRLGSPLAPVTILEFADFQCPACRTFAIRDWPRIRALFSDRVALVFRHWPLNSHPFAYAAAIASECAHDQGKFFEFHDGLFMRQKEIGVRPMTAFALEAGVADIPRFEKCASREGPLPSIEADIAAAKAVGGRGTPTLVVNGTRYNLRSDSAWLPRLVDPLLSATPSKSRRR
jgi:protein-disulfide isomerase